MNQQPTSPTILIAIDGPAASGKGTVARRIAKYFDLDYLDTGKIYRTLGKQALSRNIDLDALDENDEAMQKIIDLANNMTLNTVLNAKDLGSEKVGKAASIVSAIPEVRSALLNFQRQVAANPTGAVLDGRDIATVVCPNADLKFYITADLEIRTDRRYKELQKTDDTVIREAVLQDLKGRDERDMNRETAPLTRADDAIFIDTSTLSMEEVFEKVKTIIHSSISKN